MARLTRLMRWLLCSAALLQWSQSDSLLRSSLDLATSSTAFLLGGIAGAPRTRCAAGRGLRGSSRGASFRQQGAGVGRPAASVEALLQEAEKLRQEAEVEQDVLEKERAERGEGPGPLKELQAEVALYREKLETAQAKARRAEAFKLPECDSLRREAEALENRVAELDQAILDATQPPEPVPVIAPPKKIDGLTEAEWEQLARSVPKMGFEEVYTIAQKMGPEGRERLDTIMARHQAEADKEKQEEEAKRVEAAQKEASELRSQLTWERLQEMSNEERFELAKKIGPAFGVSVVIVGVCYWSISLLVLLFAFHETTGDWPAFSDLSNLEGTTTAAGVVAAVLSLAALLKPLRLLAAMLLTPWTAENILPKVPWLTSPLVGAGQEEGHDKKR